LAPPLPDHPLSSLSHDLRSPLSGLIALIDLLDSGIDGPLLPAQRERLRRIRVEVSRIVSLADQITELALAQSGRLGHPRAPIQLPELDADGIRAARPQAPNQRGG